MKKKKISFIIPTYNGAQFIGRCVDSILKQKKFDVAEIDLLLIDDGSNDATVTIAKQYVEDYPNIVRFYSHPNMGVARTRNRGIELATGEYLSFIDQDDYIDDDFCQILYSAAKTGNYDVVFSGMKRPDDQGNIRSRDVYTNTEYARLMCMSVWAKLHKTIFVKKNNIKLFDNKQGEDIAFTFEEYQKTSNMIGLSYCGYNWFYNRRSVSNTSQRRLNNENVASIIRLQDRLFELDVKKNDLTMFFLTMISAYYVFFCGKGSTSGQLLKGEAAIIGNLRKNRPSFYKNRYLLKSPSGTLRIFSVGVKCYIILNKLKLMNIFARVYCKGGKA